MAQPSVASYFNTRKRNAVDDLKVTRARKVLLLENDDCEVDLNTLKSSKQGILDNEVVSKKLALIDNSDLDTKSLSSKLALIEGPDLNSKVINLKTNDVKPKAKRVVRAAKSKKLKEEANQQDIQELITNMTNIARKDDNHETAVSEKMDIDPVELLKTPPATPTKKGNAMDKVRMTGKELNMKQIKQKLSRSNRLAELKASMNRFNEAAIKLEQIEKKTAKIPDSPSLKTFKSIELEVAVSPQKVQSPEKAYMSPRKDTSARKNLLNLLSPTKNAVAIPASPKRQLFAAEKSSLTLPFKYRTVAEMFRSIDTVCQIMHNRKETITFKKLKPAVEELLKRTLLPKHLSQIKAVYPESYTFRQEKLRQFGTGIKQEKWELVVEPVLDKECMSSDCLLDRRRRLFGILIEKVKHFHHEFLQGLDPPMNIPPNKITRWHPMFDIERVPDIELAELPQPPNVEKFSTGKDVLEKAKQMFNCNSRMEQALERLKKSQETNTDPLQEKPKEISSVLKGVPKALLEKVRQRQAAKALESMTRSDAKDKELQMYNRLSEFARLTRNLFVAERKSVLSLDVVVEKLENSMRSFMPKTELEAHLRLLSKEFPTWLVFHNIRNTVFIKILKDADLSLIINKLEKLIKLKSSG